MALAKKKVYTAEEFFYYIPESNCEIYELFDGGIIALALPNITHQRLSKRLTIRIDNFIMKKGGKCEVFSAPTDVKLDDYNVAVPDIFIACEPDKFDKQKYNGAPDFIIEIASSNRSDDFIRKLALYERFGVREYWIVDPENSRTVVYYLEHSSSPSIFAFDAEIPVGIYSGELAIKISDLLPSEA